MDVMRGLLKTSFPGAFAGALDAAALTRDDNHDRHSNADGIVPLAQQRAHSGAAHEQKDKRLGELPCKLPPRRVAALDAELVRAARRIAGLWHSC